MVESELKEEDDESKVTEKDYHIEGLKGEDNGTMMAVSINMEKSAA